MFNLLLLGCLLSVTIHPIIAEGENIEESLLGERLPVKRSLPIPGSVLELKKEEGYQIPRPLQSSSAIKDDKSATTKRESKPAFFSSGSFPLQPNPYFRNLNNPIHQTSFNNAPPYNNPPPYRVNVLDNHYQNKKNLVYKGVLLNENLNSLFSRGGSGLIYNPLHPYVPNLPISDSGIRFPLKNPFTDFYAPNLDADLYVPNHRPFYGESPFSVNNLQQTSPFGRPSYGAHEQHSGNLFNDFSFVHKIGGEPLSLNLGRAPGPYSKFLAVQPSYYKKLHLDPLQQLRFRTPTSALVNKDSKINHLLRKPNSFSVVIKPKSVSSSNQLRVNTHSQNQNSRFQENVLKKLNSNVKFRTDRPEEESRSSFGLRSQIGQPLPLERFPEINSNRGSSSARHSLINQVRVVHNQNLGHFTTEDQDYNDGQEFLQDERQEFSTNDEGVDEDREQGGSLLGLSFGRENGDQDSDYRDIADNK